MKHCRPKIVISFTIVVWSIFLLQNSQTIENEDATGKWLGPPSMDAFENYEYLHTITDTNAKTKNENQNLLVDSFIDGLNYQDKSSARVLVKRETTAELRPKVFKFGLEDAKEPDEATKELIRKHRAREFQEMDKKSKRIKRRAPKTEPRLIKFDVSDAREPDDITKELIRQSRARELRLAPDRAPVTTTRAPQSPNKKVIHKRKRTRRSAEMTPPQFIRFKLADAKEPNENMRDMIQKMRPYESKHRSMNHVSRHDSNDTENTEDSVLGESKKIFFYQAVPSKPKRIANSLPIEVKKIIELMIRDSKAQAFYKYVNANQEAKLKTLDKARPVYTNGVSPHHPAANNLVNIYPDQAYVQKLVPIPIPVKTISVNALPLPSQQHPSGPAPHPATVSAPADSQEFYHSVAPIQSQTQPATPIYQQPATYLKVIPAMTQVFKELPTAPALHHQQIQPQYSTNSVVGNEISQPYPYGKLLPVDTSYRYGKKLNFYPTVEIQQAILTNEQGTSSGFEGDITHQSQQKLLSQNDISNEQQQIALKDNQEFQDLSSLIGKSPTDQIHGLAYLLAKEMQRNKRLKEQRPQDNTSPILFHPEKNVGVNNAVSQESGELPTQPELTPHPVPEALPQTYPPATQHDLPANHVAQDNLRAIVAPPPPPPAPPTSYNVVNNLGLSPNYEGIDQFDEAPKVQPDVEDGLGLQYASKYAFGYRVRDFYSGNDFGHKQNRDLDGVTRGQYHILLPDGRVQNVIYHADDTGFHADVSFETGHH